MGNQEYKTPQDALAHFGVKGMRWGIRTSDALGGGGGSARDIPQKKPDLDAMEQQFNANAVKIHKDLAAGGVTSESLKAKYGPEEPASGDALGGGRLSNLSTADKVKIGLGVAAVAGLGYAVYKSQQEAPRVHIPADPAVINRINKEQKQERDLAKLRDKVYGTAAGNGLDMHWENGVDLPAGHIFSRVSTVPETTIRDHGFFAAHDPADIDRYKAILPTFWQQWGIGSPRQGGYVNNYKAKNPIKAPSGKESFAIYKNLLDTNPSFARDSGYLGPRNHGEDELKYMFAAHSQGWAGANASPATKTYFDAIKAKGYNALIDFNDAGTLSNQPMRLLNSTDFEISSNTRLDLPEMMDASNRVVASLKHMLVSVYDWLRHPKTPMEAMRLLRAYGPP